MFKQEVLDNKKKKVKKVKNLIYCGNCGKTGHLYKQCSEPITSIGVILIKISTDNTELVNQLITTMSTNNTNKTDSDSISLKADGIHVENKHDIKVFCKYMNNINFLMIQRKHTLGFIEFVRGRYNVDNIDGIIFLFRQMTPTEIVKIGKLNFDDLWDDLWSTNRNKGIFHTEYLQSKQKFTKLSTDNGSTLPISFFVENVKSTWDTPEWGFPKGRRNNKEDNMTCAIREFQEETSFDNNDFVILDKIKPIEEKLIGTNGISYKHIYYIALATSDKTPIIDVTNHHQTTEIGNIGWFTHEEGINLIRSHHIERRKLFTELYLYMINNIVQLHRIKET